MTTLFDAGRIGAVTLRNRVVMAPMTTRLADEAGHVTDDLVAYYATRARGGAGMIIVEMASPERCGRHRFRELGICEDRFTAGLARLAQAIRREGAVPAIQLGHGGGHTSVRISGEEPVAPSAVEHPLFEVSSEVVVPKAMTAARIHDAVDAFVAAARRAKEAGFEVVEIHAAHGYLISQFLSPAENTRSDEYGGSLRNRARFGLEIVKRITETLPGLPVVFRYNSDDFFPGGIDENDALQIGAWAELAGAAALHLSGGHYRSLPSAERMIPPMRYEDACFAPVAQRLSTNVGIPVILAGRLGDPRAAQEVLDHGAADFVALGRPLLADPQWPLRVQQGLAPRPCLACNTCVDGMRAGSQLRCLVNPAAARELKWKATPVAMHERVAVIGAGPAGLTCARELVAHNDVTLFERAQQAGGAFRLAGLAPLFQGVDAQPRSFERYVDGMLQACTDAGATVRLGESATQRTLEGFDRVIVATGAQYRFGLGAVVPWILRRGWGRRGLLAYLMRKQSLRELFYYALRRPDRNAARLAQAGRHVHVIGDASRAGKSMEAIESAFTAVYGPPSTAPLQVSSQGKTL